MTALHENDPLYEVIVDALEQNESRCLDDAEDVEEVALDVWTAVRRVLYGEGLDS